MLKDVMKTIYMANCRRQCKKQSTVLQRQLVYLASFPGNNNGWVDELIEQVAIEQVYYAYTDNLTEEAQSFLAKHPHVKGLVINQSATFFKDTLPVIAQSQFIIADNYFPFLAALPSKDKQKVIQVWHADGAIKCFGLEDPKNKERSQKDNERFKAVYQSFTDYIVGSKAMGEVFQHSYGAQPEMIHYTGFPRTDYLVNEIQPVGKALFTAKNPQLNEKTIVLYAPTYREDANEDYPFSAEWLSDLPEVAVIERYHPHSNQSSTPFNGSYEELLAATDILITDYSSIPFDYALANPAGQMIFYQYDEALFEERFGIQAIFKEQIPGKVIRHHEDLIAEVANLVYNGQSHYDLAAFNQKWNTYNQGKATKQFIEWLNQQ